MNKFVLININAKGPIKTDLSFISGSAIRGTYINKYITKNKIKEDISLNKEYRRKLLSEDIRFYDAYPMIDNYYSMPTPLCFYASKDEIKKFSKDKNSMKIVNEFYENVEEGYQRINKSDFSIIKSNAINLVSVKRVENLHNCKQINEENIFRYEAIDKDQQFYTIIQCEEDLVGEVRNTFDKEIVYIGGSKSSGYGRCELSIEGIYDFDKLKNKLKIGVGKNQQKQLNIYFISDALIKDENGNISSYISEKLLEEKLDIKNVQLIKSSVLTRDTKGYNAMWKTSIPSITAIKSGSIMTYSYEGQLDYNKINDFEIYGVGSKKVEGYGRIIINPSFDVNKCEHYSNKKDTHKVNVDLSKESKVLMTNILNNINKAREDEYLAKIVVEAIDSKTDSKGLKKVILNEFTNSQKGRMINILNLALDKLDLENEEVSKNELKKFKSELKTKSKDQFRDKSKISLFTYSLYDYLEELISNKTIEELTNTSNKIDYVSWDNMTAKKSSNYKLKLLLTKKIVSFNLRKNGGKNNER